MALAISNTPSRHHSGGSFWIILIRLTTQNCFIQLRCKTSKR